jgi:polysaccharide export outer membrane protein
MKPLLLTLALFLNASVTLLYGGALEDGQSNSDDILRPNDVVKLAVYGQDKLTSSVRILKTGNATFPLIESVKIGGLSVGEATKLITDLYNKDFLVDPKVTLTISESATEFVSVIGEVVTPGPVDIPETGNLNILSAIASAGFLTETADRSKIQIIRADGTSSVMTYSQVQGKQGLATLQSADRIIVHKSPFAGASVSVIGHVTKPGPVTIPPTGNLDIATALSSAGGPTLLADTSRIQIVRSGGSTTLLSLGAIKGAAGGSLLQNGDRIIVNESPYARSTITISGQIKKPGVVNFPPDALDGRFSLATAIALSGGITELGNEKKITLIRKGKVYLINFQEDRRRGKTNWLAPGDIIRIPDRVW